MSDKSALLDRITIEDGKSGGRPCIRGNRMRVADVLDLLSSGRTVEEILARHPSLERDDVLAAVEYAARRLSGDEHPWKPFAGTIRNEELFKEWQEAIAERRREIDADPNTL